MKLVELIRRMHFHSKLQLKKGRRLHITDERFLKEAEKMVCDEVSVFFTLTVTMFFRLCLQADFLKNI